MSRRSATHPSVAVPGDDAAAAAGGPDLDTAQGAPGADPDDAAPRGLRGVLGARGAPHHEIHATHRIGWLRAAVLGADDGIVSTASLMIGVAAANASRSAVLVAGLAGLVAGAMSMAAGEYVSVSSQRDAEHADIAREIREQATNPAHELRELRDIYVTRGLEPEFATEVARKLMASDPLGSHLRDELGILEQSRARPTQAAAVSATSFALGAAVPLAVAALTNQALRAALIAVVALVLLAATGAIAGRIGGASSRRAALRVFVGGGLAMGITAAIGALAAAAGI